MHKIIFTLALSIIIAACAVSPPGKMFAPGSAEDDTYLNNTTAFLSTPTGTQQLLELLYPQLTVTKNLNDFNSQADITSNDQQISGLVTSNPNPTQIPATPHVPTESPPFRICSPLETNPIEDLPKIISDPYNPPPAGHDERHHGVDFSYYQFGERTTIHGAGVQSVLAGKVAAAIPDSYPYGNFVIIETPAQKLPLELVEKFEILSGQSLYLLYAHMEAAPQISLSDDILACYPLGSVGKSGNAGVSHLHFEARIGPSGAVFPVMSYYLMATTPEEKEYYLLWRTSGKFQHFNPMDLLLFDSGIAG